MGKKKSRLGVKGCILIAAALTIPFLFALWAYAAPAPTGEIRLAVSELGNDTMDPVLTSNGAKPMMTPFYDNLIGVGPDGKLSRDTGVARDWKLSPDSMSLTIWIRPGIKFHNGDSLTSADVKFTLEQFSSPRCVSSEVGTLRKIIKSIETPDPLTVVVRYNSPNAVLPNFLSRQMGVEGSVLPKNYFEKHGAQYFNTHPIGSGPFKFVEHKVGSHVKYEAVDYPHWLVGVPKIKYLTFYLVKEESARIAMLKTGEVDVTNISRDRIPEVPGFTPYEKKGFGVIGMYLNNTWDTTSYLSNIKFREALSLAINRAEIKDFIFGGRMELTGSGMVYGSYALDYKPLPVPRYDPERAKQLVKEAFPGKTPELNLYSYPFQGVPELQRVGEAIAGYWDKIGVKTKILPTEYATYRTMLSKGNAENSSTLRNSVAPMVYGNRPLWDAAFHIAYHTKGLLTQVHSPDVDKKVEAVLAEIDPAKLGRLHYEMAAFLNQQFYQIPLGECGAIYAADPKKVPSWPNLSAPLGYDMYMEDLYRR